MVSVDGIAVEFSGHTLFKNVSFVINENDKIALMGKNGAGKSTMMKIITGFIPSNQGETDVCGLNVSKEPLKTKNKIGYLAEQNPLYYDMYVREYLSFIAGVFKLKNTNQRMDSRVYSWR